MSRRKQACPQQVQDQKTEKDKPKGTFKQANRLAACAPTSLETIVVSQSFERQLRNGLLIHDYRPREIEEKKAGHFAFLSGKTLKEGSMSDENNSDLLETEKNKAQQIKADMDEETQKSAASPEQCIIPEKFTAERQDIMQDCEKAELNGIEEKTADKEPTDQEGSPSYCLKPVSEDSDHTNSGMTLDNMSSWEKHASGKIQIQASINSSNQSAEIPDNRYTSTNEEFYDVKIENSSCNNNANDENVMKLTSNAHVNHDDRMGSSPDSEKENLTAAKMIDILSMGKHQDVSLDEGKELDKIKDQVRMLQQQQMYQVQMLNYLQFQLSVMASNPQSQQKSPPGIFAASGLNGLQLQNMPQLLAAAATMSGSPFQGARPPNSTFFPTMAAAINQQLSSNKPGENPQQIFGSAQNAHNKKFELSTNENIDQRNSESRNDSYNPLSSLALLQNASQIRPTAPEVLTNHLGDNIDNDDSYLKHVCRFCQKAFGSDSALQIHLRSHTGERPYKCNICANRFSTKGNLKVHFVRHKERYPHIEMNPNPVPEYLDNIPTSSGIPYGMSVVPDVIDNKAAATAMENDDDTNSSSVGKHSVELPIPYQCLDNGKKYDNNLAKMSLERAIELPKIEGDSEKPTSQLNQDGDGLIAKQMREAAYLRSAAMATLPMNYKHLITSGERQEDQLSRTALSVSPAVSDKMFRNPSSEYSNEPSDQNVLVHKPNTSSSETTKLQQLVEQIDRGKELEKNECHICHRILSCQSALKLHYRTHTGERPYKCDLCSRAFTTRGNLRTHYSSVHRQQLQNITADHIGVRGNALQCPLCGSRFMDQQSFQQHMQMHIYMHNQQHAIQLMNGQVPPVTADYRGRSVVNGAFPSNLALERQFTQNEGGSEQNNNDDDEVFEENLSEKNASIKENEPSKTTSPSEHGMGSNPVKNQPRFGSEANIVSQPTMMKSMAIHPSAFTFNTDLKEKHSSSVTPDGAVLDLSRPSSNSSSSNAEPKISTPSSPLDTTTSGSPAIPTTSSLDALATLASNDPTLRLNDVPSANLQLASIQDEARARKMTTACEICNKPFTCQSALEIHLRSHTKERPFVCRVCERGFTTKGNLKQHLLTHNITDVDEDMLEPVASPINGNSNSCSPPVSSTPQVPSFNQLKRHHEAPPSAPPAKREYPRHWCHICQKQFSSASSLQIHNRTHTGEKPFACSVCGRAFTTKGNLKVHMGTHVWGAGGSRRGRRISMDNPLISPWMQNTSNTNASNPPLRPRAPVPDQAALYQQYVAFASGLSGAKNGGDPRFHNAVLNLNNVAAKLMMSNNVQGSTPVSAPSDDKAMELSVKEEGNKSVAEITTEWIWNAYKKSQEQDVN